MTAVYGNLATLISKLCRTFICSINVGRNRSIARSRCALGGYCTKSQTFLPFFLKNISHLQNRNKKRYTDSKSITKLRNKIAQISRESTYLHVGVVGPIYHSWVFDISLL